MFWVAVIVHNGCSYKVGPYENTNDILNDIAKVNNISIVRFEYYDGETNYPYINDINFIETESLNNTYSLQVVTHNSIINFGRYNSFSNAREAMLNIRKLNPKYRVTLWDQLGNSKHEICKHLSKRVIINVVQSEGNDDDIVQFLT